MLQVAEDAAEGEPVEDLGVESALARVRAVVDGEAGDDGVEHAEVGQRDVEVVSDDLDQGVTGEALPRRLEHRRREVEADGPHPRPVDLEEGEQPAAAGAEVEDARDVAGDQVEQDGLPLGAVGDAVGARQVGEGMLARGPLVRAHAGTVPA